MSRSDGYARSPSTSVSRGFTGTMRYPAVLQVGGDVERRAVGLRRQPDDRDRAGLPQQRAQLVDPPEPPRSRHRPCRLLPDRLQQRRAASSRSLPTRCALQLVGRTRARRARPGGRSSPSARPTRGVRCRNTSTSSISASLTRQRRRRRQHCRRTAPRGCRSRTCARAGARRAPRSSAGSSPISSCASRSAVSHEGLARVLQPARERDLAGVARERAARTREDQRRLRQLDQRREHGGESVAGARARATGRRRAPRAEPTRARRRVPSRAMVEEAVLDRRGPRGRRRCPTRCSLRPGADRREEREPRRHGGRGGGRRRRHPRRTSAPTPRSSAPTRAGRAWWPSLGAGRLRPRVERSPRRGAGRLPRHLVAAPWAGEVATTAG